MKKLLALLTLCTIAVANVSAQTASITGTITDTLNKQNLGNTSVVLLKAEDSVLVGFTRSKKDGSFELKNLPAGKFLLLMTYPSYADYAYPVTLSEGSSENVGLIKVTLKSRLLQEVLVRQKVAAIRVKGDTLEYNADSFKVREGASVEEMLRKLPGLQVDKDGNITAQGEKVQKVLVDGEEFFGDDPTMATKNLQADAIDKVQVFDKKSDQSAFTGIDDGSKSKTLNLTLKEDKKKGYFGKIELAGGPNNRWSNNVMANSFKSKRKLSVFGIMSSTGKTGLNWDESSKYGENNNIEYSEDGGFNFTNNNDDLSSESYYGEGLPTSWSAGLQYSKKYNDDKQNINGSYRYNKLNTAGGGNTISESILPGSIFYNRETRNTFSTKQRQSANGTYDYAIDSFTSLKIKANGYMGKLKSFSSYTSESLDDNGNMVQSNRNTSADGDNSAMNSNFLLRHRFKKPGRTISLAFDQQYKKINTTGFLYSVNRFSDESVIKNIDTVDQRKINEVINSGNYTKLAYTEPIFKNNFLELSYGLRFSNSESKKLSYDQDGSGKYENLNDSFSNNYKYHVLTNSAGAVWRYNDKKVTASAGGDVAFADFKQTDLLKDSLVRYNYKNVFPKANFTYKINSNSRINLNYNGSTQQPSIEQIQPVRDNTNTLNIAIGNPNLKQEFRHTFYLNFNSYKVLKQRGFFMYSSFSTTSNSISTSETTIISGDSAGVRTYQYINLGGNYNGYGGINYNIKVTKLDMYFNIGLNLNANRNKNIVSTLNDHVVNTLQNTTDNNSYGVRLGMYKFKEKKFDINYNVELNYNTSKSTVNSAAKTNYYTHTHNVYVNVTLPYKFEVNTNVEANFRQKTDLFSGTGNNNIILWNAYLGRKLFKNDKGMVSIKANDLLDQNRGYNRYINSTILREDTYQTLRRYFLLNFTWNFTKNPGGAAPSTP